MSDVTCLTYPLKVAARRLGIGPELLRIKAKDGEWPGRMIGNAWKFTDEDLLEIVELCRVKPKAPAPTGATSRSAAHHARSLAS